MEMILASIIIVNYNGKLFLKECIDAIKCTEASDAELIVVDNASIDGSCNYIREKFPYVRLIALEKNFGFAEANNIGAKYAVGDYLIFLNNDTVVTNGWFNALSKSLLYDPKIGVVGSKVLLYNVPGKINSAGADITFNGGGYDVGFMDNDGKKYSKSCMKGAVCAASMMVRKKEFLYLGGFDPLYFMYFEDVDLCWQYWLSGFKVVYVPDSIVYHRFGGTAGSDRNNPRRVFWGTRNSIFNVLKNYEWRNVFFPLLFNLFFHFGKFILFLFTFKIDVALSILKAYGSCLKNLTKIFKHRKTIQQRRKMPDKYLLDNSVIVTSSKVIKEFFRLKKL